MPGDFVKAPFGSTEITGVIWPHEQKTNKKFKLKKIKSKIETTKLNSYNTNSTIWGSNII